MPRNQPNPNSIRVRTGGELYEVPLRTLATVDDALEQLRIQIKELTARIDVLEQEALGSTPKNTL